MQASVVVVNWRQPELTARALEALKAQTTARSFEVVLVDNESQPDAAASFRREFPDVVVVEEERNRGFAGGVGAGVRASSGAVVVLVNNDAVPDPSFLEAGLRALEEAPSTVAAVSAAVVLEGRFARADVQGDDTLTGLDGRRWRRVDGGGAVLLNGTGVEMTRDGNGYDRDWLTPFDGIPERDDPFGFSGGAVFIRRAALDEVGGFDESLFMYYEDVDVSWRLRLAGYRISYAPSATIVHRHAGSSSSGGELVRRQSIRNRVAVVVRNGSWPMIARVAARTAARFALDVARPGSGYLPRHVWLRLIARMPGIVVRALRQRRAAGSPTVSREAVERLLH